MMLFLQLLRADKHTFTLLLDLGSSCSDGHTFGTRLVQRPWVYILRRMRLRFCCSQMWINMPQLKRAP